MGHPDGNPFTLLRAQMDVCRAQRRTKHLQTHEDWSPSVRLPDHKGRFLRASYLPFPDGSFSVRVWGADDFGMGRDFVDGEMALQIYRRLPNPCTRAALADLGFRRE